MADKPSPRPIHTVLVDVMRDVGAVRKDERNPQQGFSFRGIDAVVKAVYPALVKHGVVVFPTVVQSHREIVEIGQKRTPMGHVTVQVRYTFVGPDGDSISATVVAEAMDSGDKATAKAMSVAFRTALLQTLCLPTDEPDPDASTYERAPAATAADLLTRLGAAADTLGTDLTTVTAKFRREHGDMSLDEFNALPAANLVEFVQSVEAYARRHANTK